MWGQSPKSEAGDAHSSPLTVALDAFTPLRLLAVLLLVLLNGFFVASEFAIVKVRRTQLVARGRRGDARAKVGTHVVDHLDAYLSATQLGITLASLGLGWIGEPFVAAMIEPLLLLAGITSLVVLHTIAFTLAFAFITFLHIVLGELAPKSLAIQRAEAVTLWTARPLHWFYVAFKPFIWTLNGVANLVLRAVGIRPVSEAEMVQSEEELRMLLAEAGQKRALGKDRADFLLRALRLADLSPRNVMTPRTRVVHLDARSPFAETFLKAREAGYSRYPVADESLDQVLGFVHMRDLYELNESPRSNKDIRGLVRPLIFIPDSAPLQDALNQLLARGVHMAVVTDEYGSTAGIITLEDVFEELFGEIRDEFDVGEVEGVRVVSEGHFILDGQLPLHQASSALAMPLESDATTLGGHITAQLGRLPQRGERLRIGPYEVVVREVDKRRVQSVEFTRATPPGAARGASNSRP